MTQPAAQTHKQALREKDARLNRNKIVQFSGAFTFKPQTERSELDWQTKFLVAQRKAGPGKFCSKRWPPPVHSFPFMRARALPIFENDEITRLAIPCLHCQMAAGWPTLRGKCQPDSSCAACARRASECVLFWYTARREALLKLRAREPASDQQALSNELIQR